MTSRREHAVAEDLRARAFDDPSLSCEQASAAPEAVPSIDRALTAWRRAIGAANVVTATSELGAASTATFATHQTVAAILRPADTEALRRCLRIATRHAVAVHPVSGGKNWGYGSRVPPVGTAVLVDLSRLDRIRAFDEQLGYVTVEPGVTFRMLYAFLRKRRSSLMLNTPATSPEASCLANALERGIGAGRHAERALYASSLEVVLPTGELLRTGAGQFDDHELPVRRWSAGPSLDGLFMQSNLGVVTALTLWLHRVPQHYDAVSFTLRRSAQLGPFVDALQALQMDGVIQSSVKLVNVHRWLTGTIQYPWSAFGDALPLTKARVRSLFDGAPFAWSGRFIVSYPSAANRTPTRRRIAAALRPFVDELELTRPRSKATRDKDGWGAPFASDIASTYWRKRTAAPADPDPDRDRCGVIFVSPLVPLTGTHVRRATRIIEREALASGFEPTMAMTITNPRSVYLVAPVFFDRAVDGEDQRALACAERCLASLARAGYWPYRSGIGGPRLPSARTDAGRQVLARIKAALDPAGVLAPGRSGPRSHPTTPVSSLESLLTPASPSRRGSFDARKARYSP